LPQTFATLLIRLSPSESRTSRIRFLLCACPFFPLLGFDMIELRSDTPLSSSSFPLLYCPLPLLDACYTVWTAFFVLYLIFPALESFFSPRRVFQSGAFPVFSFRSFVVDFSYLKLFGHSSPPPPFFDLSAEVLFFCLCNGFSSQLFLMRSWSRTMRLPPPPPSMSFVRSVLVQRHFEPGLSPPSLKSP